MKEREDETRASSLMICWDASAFPSLMFLAYIVKLPLDMLRIIHGRNGLPIGEEI